MLGQCGTPWKRLEGCIEVGQVERNAPWFLYHTTSFDVVVLFACYREPLTAFSPSSLTSGAHTTQKFWLLHFTPHHDAFSSSRSPRISLPEQLKG